MGRKAKPTEEVQRKSYSQIAKALNKEQGSEFSLSSCKPAQRKGASLTGRLKVE
jgi:hypothetical protein